MNSIGLDKEKEEGSTSIEMLVEPAASADFTYVVITGILYIRLLVDQIV